MAEIVTIPKIESVLITPNPATINQKCNISVYVTDIEITIEPVWSYSGEIYSGEI